MIVIWRRPNNTYYYRQVRGTYRHYEIGCKNQYYHECVLIIDTSTYVKRDNFIKRILLFLIRRLMRLYKKLQKGARLKMGEGTTAMQAVVTALQGILTTDAMFTNLAALIPVIGGVLIFAFTYRIIRRIISGANKAKARV